MYSYMAGEHLRITIGTPVTCLVLNIGQKPIILAKESIGFLQAL
jgi:hypothetical protein